MFPETGMGPINPVNGFPHWWQDGNGLALEMCLDDNGLCIFDPVEAGNTLSEQIGFGAEGFWFLAGTSIGIAADPVTLPTGGSALLDMAMEAAWLNETPVAGEQFPFNRLRIRIDTPCAGTYTVEHPYGTEVFAGVPAGVRGINLSRDIGAPAPNFSTALSGSVGPFITALNPAPPAGYIGDPGIDQTITGSPVAQNYFRVIGPAGCDLDGVGGNDIMTPNFSVMGKVFTGVLNTPLTVDRSTYTRESGPGGETHGIVVATAPATAGTRVTAHFGAGGNRKLSRIPGNPGQYGLHIHGPSSFIPRETVRVTATSPGNAPTTLISTLADVVTITEATHDLSVRRLTVRATSSDGVNPPTLTVPGTGTLRGGVLVKNGVIVPPLTVTVESSSGGSATAPVTILH
jgi:hypothetical protein